MRSVLLAFLLLFSADAFAQDTTNDLSEIASEVDAVFSEFNSATTPGCAVAIAQNGQTLFSNAYGMADLEHHVANSPSTLFEAGSVSKQFTAAAILLMEQDGKLSLDDNVRDYVPEVPDYGEPITIRHLITHTSGLRDWGSVAGISGWGRSSRTHDHDHVLDIISRQSELNFSPGEHYSYSNSGYNLLAIIGDRVADSTFTHYTEERMFKPLGMHNTHWRDDYTRIVEGRSSAYSQRNDTTFTINRPIEHVHGNAALLTTVNDLITWNNALFTGRIGGDDFVERMHEQGVLNNGRTIQYGMALQHREDHGRPVIQHTGATSGYRAYLSHFPDEDLSVALLCNVTSASAGSRGSEVARIFLGDDAGEERDPEATVDVPAEELDAFAGIYQNPLNNTYQNLVVEDDTLRVENGPALYPKAERQFRVGSSDREYVFGDVDGSERPHITIKVEGYEEGSMVPVGNFEPEADELQAFTGTFFAEDAETELRITIEDDELVVHRRPNSEFTLSPTYTDAFQGGIGRVLFHRNEAGEVESFSLSRSRVYDMRFERVD